MEYFYYANKRAWMNSELMEKLLIQPKRKYSAIDRKIILFMYNAPSHPPTFETAFSHLKVVFLPKNTTSKLQPLNAGMIENFKIHYRKQLLQHVVPRVTPWSRGSDIIDSVDILMAIRWTMNAWETFSLLFPSDHLVFLFASHHFICMHSFGIH